MIKKLFSHAQRAIFSCVLIGLSTSLFYTEVAFAKITLQSYSAKNHYRFYTGGDKNFIGSAFDASGVGRGADRWATMISEHYFITANHHHAADGATIRFYHSNDPTGAFEDHTIDSGQQVFLNPAVPASGTDLWIGKLATAPTTDVARYSVIDLGPNSAYYNEEIYTFGKDFGSASTSQALGRNTIDPGSISSRSDGSNTTLSYLYDFDDPGGVGADESFLQGGDSGGPSFIAVGSQLGLVGIHWFNNSSPDFSGDSFVPGYINQINDLLAVGGESLSVIVPEPASLALLLTTLGCLTMRRTRRLA